MMSPEIWEEEANENKEGEKGSKATETKQPRFRFLSKASASRLPRPSPSRPCVSVKMQQFKEQLSQPINEETALDFWAAQGSVFQSLKPLASDLLAVPASQAFAEQVFNITGDLSHGRRNRARVILERSDFLELNRDQ